MEGDISAIDSIVVGATGLYVGISMAISSGPDLLNLISETTKGAGKARKVDIPKSVERQVKKLSP